MKFIPHFERERERKREKEMSVFYDCRRERRERKRRGGNSIPEFYLAFLNLLYS